MTRREKYILDIALVQVENIASGTVSYSQNIISSACTASRTAKDNDGADAVKQLESVRDSIARLQQHLAQSQESLTSLIARLNGEETEED